MIPIIFLSLGGRGVRWGGVCHVHPHPHPPPSRGRGDGLSFHCLRVMTWSWIIIKEKYRWKELLWVWVLVWVSLKTLDEFSTRFRIAYPPNFLQRTDRGGRPCRVPEANLYRIMTEHQLRTFCTNPFIYFAIWNGTPKELDKLIVRLNKSDGLVKSHIPYVVHASTSSARTEYQ